VSSEPDGLTARRYQEDEMDRRMDTLPTPAVSGAARSGRGGSGGDDRRGAGVSVDAETDDDPHVLEHPSHLAAHVTGGNTLDMVVAKEPRDTGVVPALGRLVGTSMLF
jgi:hypothetical protein